MIVRSYRACSLAVHPVLLRGAPRNAVAADLIRAVWAQVQVVPKAAPEPIAPSPSLFFHFRGSVKYQSAGSWSRVLPGGPAAMMPLQLRPHASTPKGLCRSTDSPPNISTPIARGSLRLIRTTFPGGGMNHTTVGRLSPDRGPQKLALLKGPGRAAVRYNHDQFTPDHCSASDLGGKVASPRRDPGQSS